MTLLAAADVLSPAGEIDGPLFYPALSSGDITIRLDAYLTQGYARATDAAIDDPARADAVAQTYAYYRAWSDVVNRLTMMPASSALEGEGSISMLQSQIEEWIRRRNDLKAELDGLLPTQSRTAATSGTLALTTGYKF